MAEEKKGFFSQTGRRTDQDQRQYCHPDLIPFFSGYSAIDDDFYEELEETLIMGDLGSQATDEILDDLKEQVKEQQYQGAGRTARSF